MKERIIAMMLGSLNMVLLGACFVGVFQMDRKAPVLQIVNPDFKYREEMSEEDLLQNVAAYDEKDGDLTDFVVVENMVSDSRMNTVTINYGVSDSAGNVGKITCTLYVESMEEVFLSAGEAANLKGQ